MVPQSESDTAASNGSCHDPRRPGCGRVDGHDGLGLGLGVVVRVPVVAKMVAGEVEVSSVGVVHTPPPTWPLGTKS